MKQLSPGLKKYVPYIIFVCILLAVAGVYDYHNMVFKRPQSIHKWRQSDCASTALNYHQKGLSFFKPETHNLTADKGTTGHQATSELPLFYYGIARLYDVFGAHDWLYRGLNTLIFLLGVLYLFKFAKLILYDSYWAGVVALLVMCSTVLVYYGNNFLTNSTAFALVFIAWYHVEYYRQKKRFLSLLFAVLFFCLAGSLKLPSLMSLFALGAYWLVELIGFGREKDGVLFIKKWQFPVLVFVFLTPVLAWVWHAHQYNILHDTTYFSTTTFPIWDMSWANIIELLKDIKLRWWKDYFSSLLYFPLVLIAVMLLLNWKQVKTLHKTVLVVIVVQAFLFVCLQFGTFGHHDYYTINLFIFPILLVLFFMDWLKKKHPKVSQSVPLKIGVSMLLAVQVFHTVHRVEMRYQWPDEHEPLHELTPYVRSLGITSQDKIVFIPDMSHASLYLLNQPGWTEYVDARFDREEPIPYNNSAQAIQHSIDKGAKYIFLNTIEELYKKPYLVPFCKYLIGSKHGVLIFELNAHKQNFSMEELHAVYEAKTALEQLSADGEFFELTVQQSGKTKLGQARRGGELSSNEAHSGEQSVAINKESPFALENYSPVVEKGQVLQVSVWRKSTENRGELVVSADGLYKASREVVQREENGWEQISLSLYINQKLAGKKIKIYAMNTEKEIVFIDDLSIEVIEIGY